MVNKISFIIGIFKLDKREKQFQKLNDISEFVGYKYNEKKIN